VNLTVPVSSVSPAFQYNLSSALAENEKLKKQINELKEKLEAVEKENELLKKKFRIRRIKRKREKFI